MPSPCRLIFCCFLTMTLAGCQPAPPATAADKNDSLRLLRDVEMPSSAAWMFGCSGRWVKEHMADKAVTVIEPGAVADQNKRAFGYTVTPKGDGDDELWRFMVRQVNPRLTRVKLYAPTENDPSLSQFWNVVIGCAAVDDQRQGAPLELL